MDPMTLMLIVLLGVMLIFMMINGRRNAKKRQQQAEERALKMVPGARVMSRAGLFGTIVEFDADDLTKPAHVEIADGVVVELHAQSLELVPEETPADDQADETDAEGDAESTDGSYEVESSDGTYTLNGEGVEKLPGDDKK